MTNHNREGGILTDIWSGEVPYNAGDLWMIYFYEHFEEMKRKK